MKRRRIKSYSIINAISCIFLLIFIYGVCRCTSFKEYNLIYKDSREWIFSVYILNSKGVLLDSSSLKLFIEKPSFTSLFTGERDIIYEYDDFLSGRLYKEKAIVKEEESGISLSPPSLGAFYFTNILPYPSITFPPDVVVSFNAKRTIENTDSKELQDMEIETYSSREKIDLVMFNGEKLDCYLIEGRNINYIKERGQYACQYWYNDKYGFIRLLYYIPDGSYVDIKLKEVNF